MPRRTTLVELPHVDRRHRPTSEFLLSNWYRDGVNQARMAFGESLALLALLSVIRRGYSTLIGVLTY